MSAPDPLQLLTEEELARLLGASPRWIRQQRSLGRAPFRRLSPGPRGEVRFTREDVEAWQRSMLVPAQEPEAK